MEKIIFERLSTDHIEEGWLEWVKEFDPSGCTEFIKMPPNKEALIKLIDNISTEDIWLAASLEEKISETSTTKTYFGNVHISHISWLDRRCTFGRLIGHPGMRGKGMGTKLTRAILSYCFNTLCMQKVTAGCLSNNIGAIKSNLKAGMIEEAILRKDRYFNGEFVNTHLFAAWKEDWKSQ